MKPITELQKFIVSHDNWQELLEAKPYCLKIKEKGDLILFKYNQIDSDFYNPIVRESRGIILEKDTWKIVCRGFDKFGNFSEGYTDKVDFSTAKIQEKIDGSIIKLFYYNNKWNIATNGMISAFDCDLPSTALFGDDAPQTFGDLFTLAITKNAYKEVYHALMGMESALDENKTYIFEVVSPYNKVVISYPHPDIYHLGTRDNVTGLESVEDIGVPHPQSYSFNSIEDVVANAKNLPYDAEGYVVVDSQYRRCKVKGAMYLSLHHLKGEGNPSEKRLLELVRSNEGEELLSYFPEFEGGYKKLEVLYEKFIEKVEKEVDILSKKVYTTRKEFASDACKMSCPAFLFLANDEKIGWNQFREYCSEIRIESLLKYIKEE